MKPIFVLTLGDVIGLIVLGIIALAVIGIVSYVYISSWIANFKAWWNKKCGA